VSPPRVLVVDDNVVVRSGLVSLLEVSGIEVVGEAGDGQTAVSMAERLKPDLVLLDVQMPLLDGVAAAEILSRCTKVIMLTYTDDPQVVQASIGNGAIGYLVHNSFTPEQLTAAVHTAVNGHHPLSEAAVSALVGAVRHGSGEPAPPEPVQPAPPPPAPAEPATSVNTERFGLSLREIDVMKLIVQGRSNGEIASRLFLAEKTVKNHVNRIYAKLGVTSRAAAIALWMGTTDWENR
jgi:DNA-binding NarL/FixJ family response regulator